MIWGVRIGWRPWALYGGLLVLLLVGTALVLAQWTYARQNSNLEAIGPVCRVAVDSRVVALSIDDGPSPVHTRPILDLLEELGAEATFFVIGEVAAAHPGLVRRALRLGMEVGNHTWSHRDLTRLSADEQRDEFGRTQGLLEMLEEESGHHRPLLARAPYGEIDSDGLRLAAELQFTMVRWSIAVERYLGSLGMSPSEAAAAMAEAIRPGEIILAHDGGGDRPRNRRPTVETLRLLLPELRTKGYRVVSVGELLSEGAPIRSRRGQWIWDRELTCPL